MAHKPDPTRAHRGKDAEKDAAFRREFDRITARQVERATRGRMTLIGDRVVGGIRPRNLEPRDANPGLSLEGRAA